MSYLKPLQWWAKLIPWMAKCQSKTYIEQFNAGARAFDLRILWNEQNELEFRHGIYRYSGADFSDVLKFANKHKMLVRILLDIRSYSPCDNESEQKEKFLNLCQEIENKFKGIQFFGGSNIYEFKEKKSFSEIHCYSSVTSLFKCQNKYLAMIDDLCPWFYAKFKNQKNIKKYKHLDNNTYLFIDYI